MRTRSRMLSALWLSLAAALALFLRGTLTSCASSDVPNHASTEPSDLVHVVELHKLEPIDLTGIGKVTDLLREDDGYVLVAGTMGFARIDPTSRDVISEVAFARRQPRTQIADVDGDGKIEFVGLAPIWVTSTTVLNLDGSVRWRVKSPSQTGDPFDIDGDGRLDFLVADANDPEKVCLDWQGRERWRGRWKPNLTASVSCDVTGDGVDEILFCDGDALHACDAKGDEVVTVKPPDGGYVNALHLIADPPGSPNRRLVLGSYLKGQRYHEYGLDGLRFRGAVDWDAIDALIDAVPVGGSRVAFARVESLMRQAAPAGYDASQLRLRLFGDAGKLLYEDRIASDDPHMFAAILVLDADPLRLWVGYGPSILEYVEPAAGR